MILFLKGPLIFAPAWKNSLENVNTNVSAPSLISYCSKELLSYAIRCTGLSFFSVVVRVSFKNPGGVFRAFM